MYSKEDLSHVILVSDICSGRMAVHTYLMLSCGRLCLANDVLQVVYLQLITQPLDNSI